MLCCNDAVFIHYAARMQLIRGCQTPRETTPGRLRHPAPVLMSGAPGPVPVYRALKTSHELKPQGLQRAATVRSRLSPRRRHPWNLPGTTGTSTNWSMYCKPASASCNCGDTNVFSTYAPEELAGLAQPRRRPHCQYTATVDLNGLLKNQTMGEASVPRLGNRRHCRGTATAAPPLYCCTQRARQPRPRAAPVESPRKVSHKTVLQVHTGHDVEHHGPEDSAGTQREV